MKYRAIGLVFYAWVRVSIQVSLDRTGYDVRTHHTNMDTFERVRETDLKQAAVVMASFAYHAAMRQEKLPQIKR